MFAFWNCIWNCFCRKRIDQYWIFFAPPRGLTTALLMCTCLAYYRALLQQWQNIFTATITSHTHSHHLSIILADLICYNLNVDQSCSSWLQQNCDLRSNLQNFAFIHFLWCCNGCLKWLAKTQKVTGESHES